MSEGLRNINKKAIWFRIPKCASTSIRAALLGMTSDLKVLNSYKCGLKETVRLQLLSDLFPLSAMDGLYLTGDFPSRTHICQVLGENWPSYRDQYRRFFNEAYKFAVCRHPLDRYVSVYNYILHRSMTFEAGLTALLAGIAEKEWSMHDFVHTRPLTTLIPATNSKVLVDKLIRFETLEKDFHDVCGHLGLPQLALPVTRATTGSKDKHYMEYYTSETEDMAREYFEKDFRLLGYE